MESKIIRTRLNLQSIGFKSANEKVINENEENVLRYINPHEIRLGLIPEIIGRLLLCHLNPLTKDALRDIMTIPKNALIKQYIRLLKWMILTFQLLQAQLTLSYKAYEFNLGARGLRTLCEAILNDVMFNLPSSGENELKLQSFMRMKSFRKLIYLT